MGKVNKKLTMQKVFIMFMLHCGIYTLWEEGLMQYPHPEIDGELTTLKYLKSINRREYINYAFTWAAWHREIPWETYNKIWYDIYDAKDVLHLSKIDLYNFFECKLRQYRVCPK